MEPENVSDREQRDERARRPYERPGIHWEEDFLPYAYAGCGKLPGMGAACSGVMGSS